MARDPRDESIRKHQEWLGYLQPVGLVVSPPALVDADCHVNTDVGEEYSRFLAATAKKLLPEYAEPPSVIVDLARTLIDVFGWQPTDLVPTDDPRTADLVVPLPEYGETLKATYAVPVDVRKSPCEWRLLIQELPLGCPFDVAAAIDGRGWKATPEARFERLLRETGVSAGLLCNGVELRLVYAPRGESPGHVTFPVPVLCESGGRAVFGALHALLKESRVFGSTGGATLTDILAASRKYQNTVSTELAKQVLAALYELLRGFQAADSHRNGELLRDVLAHEPDQVYAGQLTVLLRLVFLLYAEDRGLMSDSEVYVRHYSVTGLFEKLRADAGRHPDTMNQRYGAWARLLTLFRIVHDGAKSGPFKLPPRHGYLFDPDRYPFLEGRPRGSKRAPGERIAPPLVSDGVLFRVLQNLLILDGERLSYRALDVEQIGSVYEAMMGFRVEVAKGRSIAIRPKKPHGAPVTINLDALLAESGDKRGKWFAEKADLKLTPKEAAALKAARSPEDAVAAFAGKVAKAVTPDIVPAGSMVLQPSDERRRSGSHYTPRSLTEPIVRKALEPVLKQLGEKPTPKQILDLKVCDPAMGSGAFLVEVCRQLGELLVKAWQLHACLPKIPPDEDELLHAQRLVAQRCVYGVDKNPMAVDLAKLSLWLTTLAKEHPFTFLDHALRAGDSLVGLTRQQIAGFRWTDQKEDEYVSEIDRRVDAALTARQKILDASDFEPQATKEQNLRLADEALNTVRFVGNLVVAAYFGADSDKKRHESRRHLFHLLSEYLRSGDMNVRPTKQEAALRTGEKPIDPFHWEIEFPEVFGRTEAGFDCIVGNPPFMGGTLLSGSLGSSYFDWLKTMNPESGDRGDLVAFFFRRSFALLRQGGCFGLIATNSIAQGDTRVTGLRYICTHHGNVYCAVRRLKWPGLAAVVVSVIHAINGTVSVPVILDGKQVCLITAFLFHEGGHSDPARLLANQDRSYRGHDLYGMGFTFDDGGGNDAASPLSEMKRLVEKNPTNSQRIFRFVNGEELNSDPRQEPSRYAINLSDLDEKTAWERWPDLMKLLEEKVKPERFHTRDNSHGRRLRANWWRFSFPRPELQAALVERQRVLTNSQVSAQHAFAFLPSNWVYSHALNLFSFDTFAAFVALQSRPHEVWARFFASSMKDDIRYTPSDCFETFPFPPKFETHPDLEAVGQEYYEFRAKLMIDNNEGLTKTYNRFHDPNERSPDIQKLRELHAAMDRAVLAAYGPPFSELVIPPCEFLLDYEDDEDDDEETGKRQKKKPWRYRWPDAFRDEILALLLELNRQCAEAEKKAAEQASPTKPKKGGGRKQKPSSGSAQQGLFG